MIVFALLALLGASCVVLLWLVFVRPRSVATALLGSRLEHGILIVAELDDNSKTWKQERKNILKVRIFIFLFFLFLNSYIQAFDKARVKRRERTNVRNHEKIFQNFYN
jgi:hypothetical protein